MKRRNFFSWLAGAVAGLFGIQSAAIAESSVDDGTPRFDITYEADGTIHLSPVLSHIIDHETRLKLAGPIRQMERAVFDKLYSHEIGMYDRTDREGIALNQAAQTLQELRLALSRQYPW